jgi:NADPH:quinone reductase-like Zn-dependent oxidoreductase
LRAYEIANPTGIDALKMIERPAPRPAHGEVLMRVRATSLNYRDLALVKGGMAPRMKLPLVPVSDGAGEVLEIGSGVTRFKPGDRVAAIFTQNWIAGQPSPNNYSSSLGGGIDGMLSEQVALSENGLVRVPDYLSYEEAASLPCAAVTSWNALVSTGRLKAGDSVLVMGTGGVSIFALQFARMHGARVIATSSSDAKLKKLREMGASDVINYRTDQDWEKRVLELTGGLGVDHIVEIGGAGTLPKSMAAVATGGRISLIGILTGLGEVNPMPILFKSACVQGILVGSREMFEEMLRAMEANAMRPVIDRCFRLEQAAEAYRYLESGAHFGKICIAL